ncbi:hypothetical protein ASJ30_08445 [Janibacter indicus]|uniref:Uncharacterized protein n=1 Tax=Janibacter indicus TaxID=857417 RepID=A0A1L3MGY5_9MICO|nr:hypothetical protein ASJ30_08445 [Janibacter indicus]
MGPTQDRALQDQPRQMRQTHADDRHEEQGGGEGCREEPQVEHGEDHLQHEHVPEEDAVGDVAEPPRRARERRGADRLRQAPGGAREQEAGRDEAVEHLGGQRLGRRRRVDATGPGDRCGGDEPEHRGEGHEGAGTGPQHREAGALGEDHPRPVGAHEHGHGHPDGEPRRVPEGAGREHGSPLTVGECGERLQGQAADRDGGAEQEHPACRDRGDLVPDDRGARRRDHGQQEVEGHLARQAPGLREGLEGPAGPALPDHQVDEHGGQVEDGSGSPAEPGGHGDDGDQCQEVTGQDPCRTT